MDKAGDADHDAAARGHVSRALYRTQAGGQAGGAVVHNAAAQSLSGFRRNQSHHHRGLRMTAAQEQLPNNVDGLPVAASVGPGARLRAAREAAGLSLDQVAQQLKLAPRQVKALEDESFGELPGRTFSRGFVRNYARLLDLDAQDLLAHLPDVTQAPALGSPTLHSTGAMMAELPSTSAPKAGLGRWLIPLILIGCIIAAAAYEWYRGGLSNNAEPARAVSDATDPRAPATTAPAVALPNPLASSSQSAAAQTAAPQSAPLEVSMRD